MVADKLIRGLKKKKRKIKPLLNLIFYNNRKEVKQLVVVVDSNFKPVQHKANKLYLELYSQETGELIFKGEVKDFRFVELETVEQKKHPFSVSFNI